MNGYVHREPLTWHLMSDIYEESAASFACCFRLSTSTECRARLGLSPGARCLDVALCPTQHNSPTCRLRHRARLFTDQAGICGWCGGAMPANLVKTSIDHIIPTSRGGLDDPWNRQLVHAGNSSKAPAVSPRGRPRHRARCRPDSRLDLGLPQKRWALGAGNWQHAGRVGVYGLPSGHEPGARYTATRGVHVLQT